MNWFEARFIDWIEQAVFFCRYSLYFLQQTRLSQLLLNIERPGFDDSNLSIMTELLECLLFLFWELIPRPFMWEGRELSSFYWKGHLLEYLKCQHESFWITLYLNCFLTTIFLSQWDLFTIEFFYKLKSYIRSSIKWCCKYHSKWPSVLIFYGLLVSNIFFWTC